MENLTPHELEDVVDDLFRESDIAVHGLLEQFRQLVVEKEEAPV